MIVDNINVGYWVNESHRWYEQLDIVERLLLVSAAMAVALLIASGMHLLTLIQRIDQMEDEGVRYEDSVGSSVGYQPLERP